MLKYLLERSRLKLKKAYTTCVNVSKKSTVKKIRYILIRDGRVVGLFLDRLLEMMLFAEVT